jgi:hypothetical protein
LLCRLLLLLVPPWRLLLALLCWLLLLLHCWPRCC